MVQSAVAAHPESALQGTLDIEGAFVKLMSATGFVPSDPNPDIIASRVCAGMFERYDRKLDTESDVEQLERRVDGVNAGSVAEAAAAIQELIARQDLAAIEKEFQEPRRK